MKTQEETQKETVLRERLKEMLTDPYEHTGLDRDDRIVSTVPTGIPTMFFDSGGYPYKVVAYAVVFRIQTEEHDLLAYLSPIGTDGAPLLLNWPEERLDSYVGLYNGWMSRKIVDRYYAIYRETADECAVSRERYEQLIVRCGIAVEQRDE